MTDFHGECPLTVLPSKTRPKTSWRNVFRSLPLPQDFDDPLIDNNENYMSICFRIKDAFTLFIIYDAIKRQLALTSNFLLCKLLHTSSILNVFNGSASVIQMAGCFVKHHMLQKDYHV